MKTKFKKVPKIIRSDRGKEYVNVSLKNFLCKEGIEVQYTVGYAPEQNDTAERKNRYLVEMAKCVLIDADLPNKYWGEVVCTANYLQNRLYTRATGTTPFEKWYNNKPPLQHIHIFGSKVYAHTLKELRRYLDQKAREFIFIGYADNAKGYSLLNRNTHRVIISRDINFLNKGNESKEVIIQEQKQEIQCNQESEQKIAEEETKNKENNQEEEKTIVEEKNNSHEDQELRRSQRQNKGIPPKRYCIIE